METFDEDIKYILEKRNLAYLFPAKATKLNGSSPSKARLAARTRGYLDALTPELKLEMLKVYELDLHMFDYPATLDFLKGATNASAWAKQH